MNGRQNHANVSQAELPVAPLTKSGLSGSTGIHIFYRNQLLYSSLANNGIDRSLCGLDLESDEENTRLMRAMITVRYVLQPRDTTTTTTEYIRGF